MSASSRPSIAADIACACGRVTLRIHGRVKSMFMCSCRDCQQATGTGHSTVAAFATVDITIVGDTGAFERKAASGASMLRRFCRHCGTPISAQSSRAPALTLIPVGLFAGAGWFAPNQLIFARSHEEWDAIAPDLPQHETYRAGTPGA